MLSRYPHISTVPADAANGLDTALPPPPPITWSGRGNLIPTRDPAQCSELGNVAGPSRRSPSSIEREGSAENGDEPEDESEDTHYVPHSWHDVALSIGAEIMNEIRAQVRDKLGYTTSAGIARNKFLAKVRPYNTLLPCCPMIEAAILSFRLHSRSQTTRYF
jgi:DNA polymerase eta